MILRLRLKKPIRGYWDGGTKDTFDWSIYEPPRQDEKGFYIKVGSFEANSWFHVSLGKTEKQTLSNAKRHLTTLLEKRGIHDYEFEYIK